MPRSLAPLVRPCRARLCLLLLALSTAGGVHAAGAGISANQASFRTGDTLKLSATIGAGSDQGILADLYLSLRTPQGVTVYLDNGLQWASTATPIASKFGIADLNAANFYSLALPSSLPNGSYTLQLAIVPTGGNPANSAIWLGIGSSTFDFSNQPLIQGLGTISAQPGGVLTVTGAGFDPNASPSLRFTNASGYSVTVPAVAATATSLTVPVPPLIDTVSGEFSSGGVSVQVTQANGSQVSNSFAGLTLNALPGATNRPAGTLTLAFLKQALAMAQQHKATLPSSSLNNTQTVAAIDRQLSLLPALISAVEQIMASPSSAPAWGTIKGRTLTLDTQALRNSDRLLLSMLMAQAQAGGFAGTGCAVQNRASTLNQAYYASTGQTMDIGTYGSEYGNCTVDEAVGKGFNFVIGTGTVAVALMAVAGAPAYALALPGAALLYLTVSEASFDFSLSSAFNDPGKALDGLNKLIQVPIDMLTNSVLPEAVGTVKDLYQGGKQMWDSLTPTPTPALGSYSGSVGGSGTESYPGCCAWSHQISGTATATLSSGEGTTAKPYAGSFRISGVDVITLVSCTDPAGCEPGETITLSASGTLSGTGDRLVATGSWSGGTAGGGLSFSGSVSGTTLSGTVTISGLDAPITRSIVLTKQ
ncbi:MAG: hypothetical protein HY850_10290 [Betaproteobacteria bacterium]|nr:hypothetical protein [Betaproteobacteria bacterium]